jgi:hypothetical protein
MGWTALRTRGELRRTDVKAVTGHMPADKVIRWKRRDAALLSLASEALFRESELARVCVEHLEIMLVVQTAKHEALRFHTCGPTCPGRRIQRVSWMSNRPCPSYAHTAKERPVRESCLLLSDSTQPGPAAESHRS